MILITGGTGKVGRELVRQLSTVGVSARVLVRTERSARSIRDIGLEAILGDLTDPRSIQGALRGVKKAFLLAPPSQTETDLKCRFIAAAKEAGVHQVVMVTAAGNTHYSPVFQARQHARAEDCLKTSGLCFAILQPTFFMQNFIAQAEGIRSQGAIYGNFGEGKIAFVDAGDIASVARSCLTEDGHDRETYVVTGAESLTHTMVVEKLSAALGKEIRYVDLPPEQSIRGMISMGYPEWLAADLARLAQNVAAGLFAMTTDVVERITRRPPIPFDQFLQNNLTAFASVASGGSLS